MVDDEENYSLVPEKYQFNSLFDPILAEFDTEISLYEQVMATFDPDQFAHLKRRPTLKVAGMTFFDGGIIDGVLTLAGKGTSKDTVITRRLKVAGQTSFKGMVAVAEKSVLAGSSRFFDNAIFGGKLTIAGKASVEKNLVISGPLLVSGKLRVADFILADSSIELNGNITASSIRSIDRIGINGKIHVDQDLVARFVEFGMDSSGLINGNIYAEDIKFENKKSEVEDHKKTTVLGLLRYLKSTIVRSIQGRSNRTLIIQGDVFADNIDIDNVIIHGNIIGKDVKIGADVTVLGKVYYENSLDIAKDANIRSVKGGLDQLDSDLKSITEE